MISTEGGPDEIERYASRVARGYRPVVPTEWPEAIQNLIQSCWAQDPKNRPSMSEVVIQLTK